MLRNMTAIYLRNEDDLLMLHRTGSRVVENGRWCGIGGHFEEQELNDPQQCVLRELFEETGIRENDISHLRLRYITMRFKKQEVRQNYYFFAQMKNRPPSLPECDEGYLCWVPMSEVLQLPMPCSAYHCCRHFLEVGQFDANLYGGIATVNGIQFVKMKEFDG